MAGLAAYSNSFANPFLFDDLPLIRDNPDLQQNWQPWRIIFSKTTGAAGLNPINTPRALPWLSSPGST